MTLGQSRAALPESERLRRERILQATSKAYEALANDPEAWAEETEELAAWDITLADGLDEDDGLSGADRSGGPG